MFKTTNTLAIAVSLSFLVCAQAPGLSGTITSWGRDSDDQVTDTPAGTEFTAIAGGAYHSLALASNGSIDSWGRDHHDQVLSTPSAYTYQDVPEPSTLILAIFGPAGCILSRSQRRSACG